MTALQGFALGMGCASAIFLAVFFTLSRFIGPPRR